MIKDFFFFLGSEPLYTVVTLEDLNNLEYIIYCIKEKNGSVTPLYRRLMMNDKERPWKACKVNLGAKFASRIFE